MSHETQLVTMQSRLMEWTRIISSRAQSGLCVDDFCRQNDITRNQYYYWLRKCRESALAENPVFTEVPIRSVLNIPGYHPDAAFNTEAAIRIADCILCLNENTSTDLITRSIEAIRNA